MMDNFNQLIKIFQINQSLSKKGYAAKRKIEITRFEIHFKYKKLRPRVRNEHTWP